MKKYIDELDKLRIHELRDLARKMGVQSPTTLKKEQIISSILDILSGEKQPYINTSRQGRPPRNQDKALSIEDVFEDKGAEFKPYVLRTEDDNESYCLAQPSAQYLVVDDKMNENDVCGYVEIKHNYAILHQQGFLPSNDDIKFSLNTVKNFKLRNGDYITATLDVNNREVELKQVYKRHNSNLNYDLMQSFELKYPLKAKSHKYLCGGKYYSEKDNIQQMYQFINNTANELCKNNDCIVRVIYVDAITENILLESNVEALVLPYNKTPYEVASAVNLFVQNCIREVETNQKVVLLICGFSNLLKYYNTLYNNNNFVSEVNYNAIVEIKNILSACKSVSENTNITLITSQLKNMPNFIKEALEYEIKPFFTEIME